MVLVEGEWSASRLSHFYRGETNPGTSWIEGWVSPRAGRCAYLLSLFLSTLKMETVRFSRTYANFTGLHDVTSSESSPRDLK
jgi:hypothetical protein